MTVKKMGEGEMETGRRFLTSLPVGWFLNSKPSTPT
jgi:hypothetical protein